MHTAAGVDNANQMLLVVQKNVQAVSEESQMLLLFRQLDSPKEREIMKFIKEKGGPAACMENDKIFTELVARTREEDTKDREVLGGKGGAPESMDKVVATLKNDLRGDLDTAIEENRRIFDRKFVAQMNQLKDLKNTVKREGDRVITAVNAGPHDRIVDPVTLVVDLLSSYSLFLVGRSYHLEGYGKVKYSRRTTVHFSSIQPGLEK
jgi:hypothetical protein